MDMLVKFFSRLQREFRIDGDFHTLEQEIQKSLDRVKPRLAFPARLEKLFISYDTPRRLRRYFILGMVSLVIYDLFCINDMLMIPDVHLTAWKIRLFIVTPVMIATSILIYAQKLKVLIEPLTGVIIVLSTASILYMLHLSSHPNEIHYHTGIILVVIFGNIVVRVKFRTALATSIITLVMFALSIPHILPLSTEAVMSHTLVLATTILVSLVGNFQIENELRRGFLYTLLHQIDLIKLEQSNRNLEMLSISDPLTGLANRRYFDASLDREWRVTQRREDPLSVIFIDIDFFKKYNDNYGHQAGDACLKAIAGEIRSFIQRPYDVCARYGGEEFIILLPETTLANAAALAERIRAGVEELNIPHGFSDISDHVTISLGVADVVPSADNDSSRVIEKADRALYQAKRTGRNRVCTAGTVA